MRNLYLKIYEAIDAGIQKALILPDEMADDISVRFRHKAISNDFTPYEYQVVDLDLPSGLKWAKYNIGAFPGLDPENWYGDYYAWGETETKPSYGWDNYKYQIDGKISDYIVGECGENPYLDELDDIVYVELHKLQMPTIRQCQELIAYTDNKWADNYNGIAGLNGQIFFSKKNPEKHIFIPAAGYAVDHEFIDKGKIGVIWSNTLETTNNKSEDAQDMAFEKYPVGIKQIQCAHDERQAGFSVRGVCK